MQETRTCDRCNRELPLSEFYSAPSGFHYVCKKCNIEYSKNYNRTHAEDKKLYDKEYAIKNSKRKWAHACLANHRRSGYAVELTSEELYQVALKTDSCFICGCRIDWRLGTKGRIRRDSPTLDRLDNGRVIKNGSFAILCYKCNATKQDRTLAQFVEYCEAISTRFHSHLE